MTSTLAVTPWRVFSVEVRALRRLGPSFLRVTLTGPDLNRFADNGYDQRIKLALPAVDGAPGELPGGPDWFQRWRELPAGLRSPIRTYTVRAARPEAYEVDVDMALHGDGGPATRWARRACIGDRIAVVGPDSGWNGPHGGVEFRPPAGATLLLVGDETAAPAICAILERLPADARGYALVEVPEIGDELPCRAPAGVTVTWLPRAGAPHGSRLTPAVTSLAGRLLPVPVTSTAVPLAEVDVDRDILWEVPDRPEGAAHYAWLAGEAAMIRGLRRHLVADRGLDRRAVAFMGYWRTGRAEA